MEDAFLETAKQIYQNIQDGSLDLNAAESGVQQKSPSAAGQPGLFQRMAAHAVMHGVMFSAGMCAWAAVALSDRAAGKPSGGGCC